MKFEGWHLLMTEIIYHCQMWHANVKQIRFNTIPRRQTDPDPQDILEQSFVQGKFKNASSNDLLVNILDLRINYSDVFQVNVNLRSYKKLEEEMSCSTFA